MSNSNTSAASTEQLQFLRGLCGLPGRTVTFIEELAEAEIRLQYR